MSENESTECLGLPPLEPGELRGSMKNLPIAAYAAKATPFTKRLLEGLRARADEVVLEYPGAGVRWTGAALRARALCLAEGLVAEGVQPGDRVTLVCGSHVEYAPLFLATLLAGAAWAPLNHTFDDGDLRLLFGIIDPTMVFAPPTVARRLGSLFERMKEEAGGQGGADVGGGEGGSGTLPALVTVGEGPEWEALTSPRFHPPPLPPPPSDPLTHPGFVCGSSGTSGLPKGVVISLFGLAASVDMIWHPDAVPKLDGETMLITSPGFWVTGIYYTLLAMLTRLTLIYEYGCTEIQLLTAIDKYKPSILFSASNFVLSAAKVQEVDPQFNMSSLRTIIPTGAAMSREAEEVVLRVMKCGTQQIYGMTEIGVALGLGKLDKHKTGSVGKLCPFTQCKVVDQETGLALGPGLRGELCFKGPTLLLHYMKNPQATADLMDERGWVHSGDVGYYDEDEYFFVTGRIKDTIKYRGVHVSPVEIEGLLDQHPAVMESAVIGVPDPIEQELPRAYVRLCPGAQVSAEELCQIVKDKLSPHKWLRGGVIFLDTPLPKSSTGKISRAAIRKRYLENVIIGS